MTWKRLTAIICTTGALSLAIYDAFDVAISGDITSSVSRWFSQFQDYAVPVFTVGFLCSHFFIPRRVKLPNGQQMTARNFWITAGLIAATGYDIMVIQFFNPRHSLSCLPVLGFASLYPQFVFPIGWLCGIAFGWMTKPSQRTLAIYACAAALSGCCECPPQPLPQTEPLPSSNDDGLSDPIPVLPKGPSDE